MIRIIQFSGKKQGIMRACSPQNQRGSAIIWIFVMISLFAALGYAVSKGTRTGITQMTAQQAHLTATEILDYNRAIKSAVQELQINGCSDTQISFENPEIPDYINPNAPPDKSCHVFHPNGGGLRAQKIASGAIPHSDYPFFIGRTAILDIGTTEGELYIYMRTLSKDVCMKYNELVGIDNVGNDAPVEAGLNGTPKFIGTYSSGTILGDDNDGAVFAGKITGCHKDVSETNPEGLPLYDYYYVLIAR